ncbi:phage shock protein C (PspC) family protein [Blastococcus fimeti]|nr:phage shock protein C (PspC) family protein [Blastococcus fimeti]
MTDAPFAHPTDQPTAPPRLRPEARRSGTDRMAGGVCGGLADYSGVDAVLWRVGFVALTLIGGSGVLLYLLLWVLLPSPAPATDEALSPLERLARRLHAAVNGSRATPPPPR